MVFIKKYVYLVEAMENFLRGEKNHSIIWENIVDK